MLGMPVMECQLLPNRLCSVHRLQMKTLSDNFALCQCSEQPACNINIKRSGLKADKITSFRFTQEF